MRNRAKCKKCLYIIESFHREDYVTCKCDEIGIGGGLDELLCQAKDWNNFTRVDDENNEIIVKVLDKVLEKEIPREKITLDKKELIDTLDRMIENIERLPHEAMITSINQYDFNSLLILLSSIFKAPS